MREVNVLEALRQASLSGVSQVFQDKMRVIIKESFINLMFEAERGFNRISGYADIGLLLERLERH